MDAPPPPQKKKTAGFGWGWGWGGLGAPKAVPVFYIVNGEIIYVNSILVSSDQMCKRVGPESEFTVHLYILNRSQLVTLDSRPAQACLLKKLLCV